MEKALFFVYGTLKAGYWNNILLKGSEFLGNHITEPKYTLYNGPYPIVERSGETAIHGELYYTKDKNMINNIFGLEGCSSQIQGDPRNGYDFDLIDTPHGEAIIFVMDEAHRSTILKNGIWK